MNQIKDRKYWILSLALFVIFAFLGLNAIIEDKTSVDGLLKIGFPLIFYTKGYFPPSEIIYIPNLIIDLFAYGLVSLGITFAMYYFVDFLKQKMLQQQI